jgi:hypothetical protein
VKTKHISKKETLTCSSQTEPINQTAIADSVMRDEVARRAYSIYQNQGCMPGNDLQHWLEAEVEVKKNGKSASGILV